MLESEKKLCPPSSSTSSVHRCFLYWSQTLHAHFTWNLKLLLCVFSCFSFLLLFLRPAPIPYQPRQYRFDPSDIDNRTLGFEKVFAISFPERTDKQDVLLLASSFIGFEIEWLAGVAFDDISVKAAPVKWDYANRSNGSMGCWRAHMNALQHIIQSNIQTALIMEDDSDFDINLKSQLAAFAEGTRTLQTNPLAMRLDPAHLSASPYGSDWDMLWLGHCRIGPREDQRDFYVFENDPTVPQPIHRHGIWQQDRVPPALLTSNSTRVVFRATNGGVCTGAYAVTYAGARKMLAAVSVHPQDDAVDISYRKFCQGRLGVEAACIGIYPTLFGSHRAAGPTFRDSDLNDKGNSWHREYTWDIVYSTMQNVLELSNGAEAIKAQWEQTEPQSWQVDERLDLTSNLETWDLLALERSEVEGINR